MTVARVESLRKAQQSRLDAEAEHLAQLEQRLALAQMALRAKKARLALDRLRYAVHGLCSGFNPPAETGVETEECATTPRLCRIK